MPSRGLDTREASGCADNICMHVSRAFAFKGASLQQTHLENARADWAASRRMIACYSTLILNGICMAPSSADCQRQSTRVDSEWPRTALTHLICKAKVIIRAQVDAFADLARILQVLLLLGCRPNDYVHQAIRWPGHWTRKAIHEAIVRSARVKVFIVLAQGSVARPVLAGRPERKLREEVTNVADDKYHCPGQVHDEGHAKRHVGLA